MSKGCALSIDLRRGVPEQQSLCKPTHSNEERESNLMGATYTAVRGGGVGFISIKTYTPQLLTLPYSLSFSWREINIGLSGGLGVLQ